MRNACCSIVAIFTLSLSTVGAAFADEPAAGDDPTPTTTAAPTPGEVSPPAAAPASTECGPLNYNRADKDQHPGRALRVTGGMFVGLGLATLIPGAAAVGWAEHDEHDPSHPSSTIDGVKAGGAAAIAVGSLSFIVGIPLIAKGVHDGKVARERPPSVVSSNLAPTRGCGGALANLSTPRTSP
jgi:hypothetical protein